MSRPPMLVRVRLALADAALRARLAARLTGPYCDLAVQDEQQVRKLLQESFDLLVLDAKVADPELLVLLRQLPDRPALVVLEPDETRWAATVAAGADSVLDPRTDFDELGSALRALVDRRRERRLEIGRAHV